MNSTSAADVYDLSGGAITFGLYVERTFNLGYFTSKGTVPSGDQFRFFMDGGNQVAFGQDNGWRRCNNPTINIGDAYEIIMSYSGGNYLTNTRIWFNGTECAVYGTVGANAAFVPNGVSFTVGNCAALNGCPTNGVMDDIAVWEGLTFNDTVVSEHYNSGDIFFWTGNEWISNALQPSTGFLTPPSPESGDTNNTNVTFRINSTSGSASLFFDNVTPPVTQVVFNQTTPFNFTTTVSVDAIYFLLAIAGDNSTNTSINWTLDTTEPEIILNPSNGFNAANVTTDIYSSVLPLNITIIDNIDLFGFSINITHPNGTSFFDFINESLSGLKVFNFTQAVDVSNFPDSQFNVTILSSDTHTANKIEDYRVTKRNKKLEFDTDEGNFIEIETDDDATTDSKKTKDRYSFEFDFTDGKDNKKRVFHLKSQSDIIYLPDSGYKAHFVIANGVGGGNWVDFEGVPGNVTIQRIHSKHYKVTFDKVPKNVKFRSIGGLNVNNLTFIYTHSSLTINEVIITPSPLLNETDLIGFCRATEGLGNTVNSTFRWYRNDSLFSSGSNDGSFASNVSFNIANITNSQTAIGDTWILSCSVNALTNSTLFVNSTGKEVFPVQLDICSPSLLFPVLNMTYFDDQTALPITISNGLDLVITRNGDFFNVSKTLTGNFTDSLCTNIDPLNGTISFDMFGQLNLQKVDYATRLYDIPQSQSFNLSNTLPFNLSLFMIKLNDSTTVNFNWLTTASQPIDGTMRVFQCEQNGDRTLIESNPIINGK